MKTLWFVMLITLSTCAARAQLGSITLSADPVFNQVLSRQVTYPIMAIRSATYGRVYAGFDIDPKGRVRNVTMLSPGNTGVGFEYEIIKALKRMPSLNPRYTGRYALPVSFVFTNWGESSEPHVPTNILSRNNLIDRLLLGEVIFRGSIRQTGVYIPPSTEIRYY